MEWVVVIMVFWFLAILSLFAYALVFKDWFE